MLSKNFSRKFVSVMVASATVLALMATPAFAAADTGVAITGGTLSGGELGFTPFSAVTLDGTAKTSTAVWTIANVIDPRGTGAGWNVSLTLTPFKEYVDTAYVTEGGKTLAASSIKVTTAPIVTQVDETSSAASTITVVAAQIALDTGSPIKLLSASADGGMGSYAVSDLTTTLSIPANAYAATYKTDATVALVVAP